MGWGYGFRNLGADLNAYRVEREADAAQHWQREFEFAQWAAETLFPEAIALHCEAIFMGVREGWL